MVKKPAKKKSAKLSPEEKAKRAHKASARAALRLSGFDRVPELAEKTFTYDGQTAEFDDAFIHENVLLLIEYTTSQESGVKTHLKGKKIIYDKVLADHVAFWKLLKGKHPKFAQRLIDLGDFPASRLILKIVYCSRNSISTDTKALFPEIRFLDYPLVKYFEKIARAIKWSALPELLDFLGINFHDVRHDGGFAKLGSTDPYHGSILPEEASGFPEGYKVVSFYADPASLLKRCFVLRRKGWRSTTEAYQRMLLPTKIEDIRKMVFEDKRVAINNLIATLPANVHPVDEKGVTIDPKDLTQTAPIKISLPADANSMGIIDGQHRLFAYYRSKLDTPEIETLRRMQNLLVTGIIYPEDINDVDKDRFEAELFLSINSNQTSASSDLIQEIEVLLDPFAPISIAKQVMERLAETGPLAGHVERYFFDKGKLKTTSIVSFGLGPLVKLSGRDSLFNKFTHAGKDRIAKGTSKAALNEYIEFCANRIIELLNAVRTNVDPNRWTTDKKVEDRILAVTYVNSFLIVLRKLVASGKSIKFASLKKNLEGIEDFDFGKFHSSQYNRMADEIFDEHFK